MNAKPNVPQKILIVDDHILFREGLVGLFRSTPDFVVLDQAGSVEEAVEKAFHHRPDIILMDVSLPDGTGLDATETILEEMPECKIIFLTVYETDENLMYAIQLGAKGYMLKNISSSSLISSLRALDQGELAMSRKMMSKALENSFSRPSSNSRNLLPKLSPREMDILYQLQNGASNNEIAQSLFLSENTVKHHVHSILEKLEVENRRQAGSIAKQLGLKKNRTLPASR